MPVTIVVGGQFGSEGKGKVAAILAARSAQPWLVRCGGPNSGHTVTIGGDRTVLRQVPCSIDPANPIFCIAAGCAVEASVLLAEADLLKIQRERIIVDPRAVVITAGDRAAERDALQGIASTCSGTGHAMVRRAARQAGVQLAADLPQLRARCRVEVVAPLLHTALARGEQVIVEGTQGFGLSLLHGPHYPYLTSRDTTAAAFAMEAGLSPRAIDEIVMVIRTFPIRVGGPSGPFPDELSWPEVQAFSGAPEVLPEYTSVTKKLRRVARFDMEAVKTACRYNHPTSLALMGLDRLDHANSGICRPEMLSPRAAAFIEAVENATGVPVTIAGTGWETLEFAEVPARIMARRYA